MNFSPQNMVSANVIMADVLVSLNDEDQKFFNPGFYISQIQQALKELSFDTYFLNLHKDFDFPSETLSLEMPKGSFNLKQVYVFNGDNCNIESSKLVWIKDGYITSGKDKGYTARNKEGNTDPFINNYRSSIVSNYLPVSDTDVLFCSIQNGRIMFSSSCSSYSKVRLEYLGTMCDIGEVPFIPTHFREAVKLWVEEKCLRYLKARNPRFYRPLWVDVNSLLNQPFVGAWDIAKQRVSNMDSKEADDLKEYFTKMNY